MQTSPDPSNINRVVVAAAAKSQFATIINDQSLSKAKTSTATATPTPTPTASADVSDLVVGIENSSGATGRAAEVAATVKAKEFGKGTKTSTGAAVITTTVIHYGPDQKAEAQALAKLLKLPTTALKSRTTAGVTLEIGSDWITGTTYPSKSASTKSALADSHALSATESSCVPVSTQKTVTVNGVSMTPIQAYSASPGKKVSAP
jgi:hypothetical protein